MNLGLIEAAAWECVPGTRPKDVAAAVSATHAAYVRRSDSLRARDVLLAQLLFYGIADAPKLGFVLDELSSGGALPASERSWRVLDIGSGPGLTSLALREWLRARTMTPELQLLTVDRDPEALRLGVDLQRRYGALAAGAPRVAQRVVSSDLDRAGAPPGRFDLILCANVLGELFRATPDPEARRAELLRSLVSGALSPGGTLCVIEPALRESSRSLHRVRDLLLEGEGVGVFAPCIRRGSCPMLETERDWCHEDRTAELPERARLIARLVGLRRHRAKFSYCTLRADDRRLSTAFPEAGFRVVSERLVSKGREEVILCGEPGHLQVRRHKRERADANRIFRRLDRGLLVALDPVGEEVTKETSVEAWDPILPKE